MKIGCLIYHRWKKETDFNIFELLKVVESGQVITMSMIKVFKYKTCQSCGKKMVKEYKLLDGEPKEWIESKKDIK